MDMSLIVEQIPLNGGSAHVVIVFPADFPQ